MLIGSRLDLKKIIDDDVTLMGLWCLPLHSDSMGDNVKYRVLESPWKTQQELLQVCEEVENLYQDLIHIFSKILNDFHELRESVRFWKILIGPWLYWLINVGYDKYFRLLKANEKNCGPLLGLPVNYFITPKDTSDFTFNINYGDTYNLQIITSIAYLINFPVVISESQDVTFINANKDVCFRQKNISLKIKIYHLIQKLFYSYANIILYNSYHSFRFVYNLFLESNGKIVEFPCDNEVLGESSLISNAQFRQKFKEKIFSLISGQKTGTIKEVILQLASEQIPICFLEGFSKLKNSSKKKFGVKIPKKIASASSWYCDELFKLWAADSVSKGTKLLGLQHGGNYGASSYLFNEQHELEITDQYFTWGWKDNLNKKIIPSPAQKLLDIIRYFPGRSVCDDILYLGTSGSRFLLQFPEVPEKFPKYYGNQVEFISNLSSILTKRLKIRLHNEDGIWQIQKRLSQKFAGLNFETLDLPFRNSIAKAKIIVCDHLSTTFIEVLASNIPIILFWDPEIVCLRSSAQPYFDQLKEIGILHDSAKSAAEFLNLRYEEIGKWWYSSECQSVVNNFCNTFAKQSSQPVKDWYNLLIF